MPSTRKSVDMIRLQSRAWKWCSNTFGVRHASSIKQRSVRLAEEAIETAQAGRVPRDMMHKLVDSIYDREPGELQTELSQLGLSILILAEAAHLNLGSGIQNELDRVRSKTRDHWINRNASKNAAGFDAIGESTECRP